MMNVVRMLKLRWRTALWILLMVIIILNAAIFFTVPDKGDKSKSDKSAHGARFLEHASSHLQVLRKRLNASFNSSSLHHPESAGDGKLEARPDGGDHLYAKNGRRNGYEKYNDENDNDNGDDQEEMPVDGDGNKVSHSRGKMSDEEATKENRGRRLPEVEQFGSRANHSSSDVDNFVKLFTLKYDRSIYRQGGMDYSYVEMLKKLTMQRRKGWRLKALVNNRGRRAWEHFHYGVRQHELYDANEPYVTRLLRDLATKPITNIEQKEGGTQIKLMITFADEGMALFKPMRFSRDQETLPDHFYFADYERHNAEIAAFHLDRILGFNRVPPTVGRLFNISSDIQPFVDSKLGKTFFISPAGNLCFHGQCSYYCDSSHPICGNPVMLEGSLAALLPPFVMAKRKTWRNPWKRSYSKHRKAYWEVYNDLCFKIEDKHPYNEDRRLMDILDMSVFDFLTGNLDRHHYETFKEFGNNTFLLHLDQGRAFGKSKYDCLSCLAPVRQCCMIRLSTLTKLVKMYQGPLSLSQLMRNSMSVDPINPILAEKHLDALDRRLSKILNIIDGCLKEGRSWDDVIVDDGVT